LAYPFGFSPKGFLCRERCNKRAMTILSHAMLLLESSLKHPQLLYGQVFFSPPGIIYHVLIYQDPDFHATTTQ